MPLIDYGHLHFGENKVQEAVDKWKNLKLKYKNIKLHFIGKLQTNKVKHILPLADYIHSLDNLKLAKKIFEEQTKKKIKPKIFIQLNFGNEIQKNGIPEEKFGEFLSISKNTFNLNIVGIMCLPPNDGEHLKYFSKMKQLQVKYNLEEISMGMSGDYLDAIDQGSSFLRIGSKIFGSRN